MANESRRKFILIGAAAAGGATIAGTAVGSFAREAEISQLKNDVQTKDAMIKNAQFAVEGLDKMLKTKDSTISDLEKNLDDSLDKIDNLTNSLEETFFQKTKVETELSAAEMHIKELNKQLKDASEQRLTRPDDFDSILVEDFGSGKFENYSKTGIKPPENVDYFYTDKKPSVEGKPVKIADYRNKLLSSVMLHTDPLIDDAGQLRFDVGYPHVRFSKGDKGIVFDDAAQRIFMDQGYDPRTFKRSTVSLNTRVPINDKTIGGRYVFGDDGYNAVITRLFINGKEFDDHIPKSGFLDYNDAPTKLDFYFNLPGTPKVPRGSEYVDLELRIMTVVNPNIIYRNLAEQPQPSPTRAMGDSGPTTTVSEAWLFELK